MRSLKTKKQYCNNLYSNPHGSGVIIWLSDDPDMHDLKPLLQAAQQCAEQARQPSELLHFVVVQHGWGASGFSRSFFLENKTISTLVINLASQENGGTADWLVQEIDAMQPIFREVFIDATGQREEYCLRFVKAPLSPTRALIDKSDVVLVTGGGKGISAECGYQLARRTGCALLIIGRSAPQNSIELDNNLKRLHKAKLRISYQQADVTNAAEVTTAIVTGITELGSPVTGIIHGAGVNHPCIVVNLTPANIKTTISPKVDGIRNLLAA